MKVFLREKKISKGRKSLYLDFYPPIVHPETGKPTRREFLNLFIYEKPKGENEREHNKETKIIGENVKAKRQLEIQAGNYGFFDKTKSKSDFIKYFKDQAENRKTSKGNYDNWLSTYNYLKAFTKGRCLMEDVTDKFCNDFREYLLSTPIKKTKSERKLSQNAAHSYFNKFRAAINQAFNEKLIQENPLKGVRAIKAGETHREYLTLEELNLLAKSECDPPVLKRLALFSALTGLRWSDITSLTWGQVQYSKSDGYLLQFTQKKTKGVEYNPISDQAAQLLGPPGETNEKVFPGLDYSAWLLSKLKLWVLGAGIKKKITFHCFRHTYATLQLTNGTDIYTVSKMLGHKNLKTTQIYAKIVDAKKRQAANNIKIEL